MLSPPSSGHLPAAVPGYVPDLDTALRELGRAHLYIAQLTAEMARRAQETNDLHDQVLVLQERVQDLEYDLAVARTTNHGEGTVA